jgi:3-hydroxybutyryl-CoA dehydrogenase
MRGSLAAGGGAGIMGAGIGQVAAQSRHHVRLFDARESAAA